MKAMEISKSIEELNDKLNELMEVEGFTGREEYIDTVKQIAWKVNAHISTYKTLEVTGSK